MQIREYRPSIAFVVCASTLVSALLLGGGTRNGFLSDVMVEVIAIPALLVSISSLIDSPVWQTKRKPDVYRALAFCSAIAALPLVQLVPLPPWVWTHLPGREPMVSVFELLGAQTPWMPISVSPHATWLSFLSLLPPIAIFLAVIQLNYRERRELSLVVIAVGVVSVFIGLSQVAEGPTSLLRFFTITNANEAVGFFANRNHFAALLYAVLLFTAVWAIDAGFKVGSAKDAASFQTATILQLTVFLLVFMVVITGEAMARSRAGLALTMLALLAVFALAFMDQRNVSGAKTTNASARVGKLLLAAIGVAFILSLQFAVYRIFDRFATDPLEDARIVFAHNTIAAAKSFMPFGSGSGTFVPVYQMFEKPIDTLANTYANRAHDDFLELWLETGILGPILICLFLIWLGVTSLKLWRRPSPDVDAFDCTLARAASVVIALLLAHSAVDYPMRTEAIMAIFAVCCGLLIEPLTNAQDGVEFAASVERYLAGRRTARKSETMAAMATPTPPPVMAAEQTAEEGASQPRQSWGAGIAWPEEWQRSAERTAAGGANRKSDTKDQ